MWRSWKSCASCVPARYILAVLGFTGITLQYILKVNLSVAIVAMVKKTASHNETNSYEKDTCSTEETDDSSQLDDDGLFEWSTSMQGLLLSSYYYGYVSTQLLGGYLAQRFGGRLVMGPGVAITGVLTLFTSFTVHKSFTGFVVLRILEGIASGVVIPSMQSMFSLWYPPQERQRMAGFIFSSINFGSLAGMGLSGLLADWGGWPTIFYATGAIAVAWFIPWILLVHDSPKTHPRISPEERDYIVSGLGQDTTTGHKVPQSVPWKHILLCPPIWAAILVHVGSAWITYTLLNELPTYLNNILHFDVKDSGILSSLPYLFAWISGNFSGALSQWLRQKGFVSHLTAYKLFNGIMCIGAALCFLVITLVGCNSSVIVIMFVASMFCNGFLYGGSYLNHVDLCPNHAGAISGILHTMINTPGFITPVVTSALLDGQQTRARWQNVFYVSIGIVCGVYFIYLIFGSVTQRSWNSWGMEDEEKCDGNETQSKDTKDLTSNFTSTVQPNYGS